MATAADSASSSHSPGSSGLSVDGLNSPHQFRGRNLTSPWANIVRGESEVIPAAPSSPLSSPPLPDTVTPNHPDSYTTKSSPDNSGAETQSDNSENINSNNNSNAARTKKPAWSKPSNGVVEVGPVMGAVSWPALSESTRASPKSSSPKSSSDSLKCLADGSATISQGPVIASSTQSQPIDSATPNSTPNPAFPRQKPMKRGGGGAGGSANGGFTQPQPPSPPQPVEMPQSNSGKPAPVIPDSSPREPARKNSSNWETGPRGGFGSQPRGSDHPQQRSSFRRGNGGPHPRGDGPYHNNFGGRRDQDRGNYEWNPHRSFNGRDVHMQQQRVVPRATFVRPPPPSSAPFISPPPVRSFGNPMGFADMTSPVYYVPAPHPDSLRGVPFIAHAPPPAIYFPAPDPQLRDMLVKQIEYYFSSENLCKDIFLRQNMDEQGWVPVSLIAGFNRVKLLTNNIPFILDVVRSSTVVEIQGDKIRKRNDWMNWPLPPSS